MFPRADVKLDLRWQTGEGPPTLCRSVLFSECDANTEFASRGSLENFMYRGAG